MPLTVKVTPSPPSLRGRLQGKRALSSDWLRFTAITTTSPVVLLERVDVRQLDAAGDAPGCPEVDVDHLAPEVAQAMPVAVEVVDLEVGGELADLGADLEVVAAVRLGRIQDLSVIDAFTAALAADEARDEKAADDHSDDDDKAGECG
jgi:hypothetical protein